MIIDAFTPFAGNEGGSYDISTASFTQIALNISGQESQCREMMFNNDGTVLYVIGSAGDDINEYSLSTPYDISTASFTQIALSVSAQETSPVSMLFNDNGTVLYVMGFAGDDINEYSLSTPYDISTASFTQIALSVSAQESNPSCMIFNNDGSVLYVTGQGGDDINEYSLSTPYDISTASFTQIALSVSAQETDPYSLLFNNDGTVLYVMGLDGDDINEYSLSTPYDISTASFTQIALSVSGSEGLPVCVIYNNEGSNIYILGFTGNIREYALS